MQSLSTSLHLFWPELVVAWFNSCAVVSDCCLTCFSLSDGKPYVVKAWQPQGTTVQQTTAPWGNRAGGGWGQLSNLSWEAVKRKQSISRKCRKIIAIAPKAEEKYIIDLMLLLGSRRKKVSLHKHHTPPSKDLRMPMTTPHPPRQTLCFLGKWNYYIFILRAQGVIRRDNVQFLVGQCFCVTNLSVLLTKLFYVNLDYEC